MVRWRPERRICPLCEATCGLELTTDGLEVLQVRGDPEDVFSRGYVCPKGIALGELHSDPRRLTTPLVKGDDGQFHAATWDEAFNVIRDGLRPILTDHGPQSVGLFLGNPNVHNLSGAFYLPAFIKALGTTQRFSASTVDQMPKQVACALMYGTALSVPVPDIDRTHYFLMLGANPLISNGSMMTAADFPGRLRRLRKRGGRLVVVDPVRTRTASVADEHVSIRPGSDALWLASLAHLIVAEATLGEAEAWVEPSEWASVVDQLAPFTPEATAADHGNRPIDHPTHRAGIACCAERSCLRAHGHNHIGADHRKRGHSDGHAGFLAHRRHQHRSRFLGPTWRGDVPAPCGRWSIHGRHTRFRARGADSRSPPHPGARAAQRPR